MPATARTTTQGRFRSTRRTSGSSTEKRSPKSSTGVVGVGSSALTLVSCLQTRPRIQGGPGVWIATPTGVIYATNKRPTLILRNEIVGDGLFRRLLVSRRLRRKSGKHRLRPVMAGLDPKDSLQIRTRFLVATE